MHEKKVSRSDAIASYREFVYRVAAHSDTRNKSR